MGQESRLTDIARQTGDWLGATWRRLRPSEAPLSSYDVRVTKQGGDSVELQVVAPQDATRQDVEDLAMKELEARGEAGPGVVAHATGFYSLALGEGPAESLFRDDWGLDDDATGGGPGLR